MHIHTLRAHYSSIFFLHKQIHSATYREAVNDTCVAVSNEGVMNR